MPISTVISDSLPLPSLAIGMPGGAEWAIILVIALLIFGRRLPEVMRSMGRGVVEFKRGIKGIEDDVEVESSHGGNSAIQPPEKDSESDAK